MNPAPPRAAENIVLVGYRACGKSVLGAQLAAELRKPLFDLDREIELAHGRSVRQLFEDEGEPWFRDVEEEMLEGVLARGGIVLAPGGGVVLRESNRRLLREQRTVFLDVPAEVLLDRLGCARSPDREKRPALTELPFEEEVLSTLQARRRYYLEVAAHCLEIPAGESAERTFGRLLGVVGEPPGTGAGPEAGSS